ncbi:MAG: SDR family oxidoreductase [Ectothiorhodospiraceae bacterium]|nr:SDR family oxidoreductase [Ectothiorhodospiraceae bacterium]
MSDLGGERILVTGAGGGIGSEIARALVGAGARVVLHDRDWDALGAIASDLGAMGVVGDLTDAASVDAVAEQAWAAHEGLEGLVNCAGIYPVTPFLEMSAAEWDAVLGLNLRAPFLLTQAVARRMVAAGIPGRVVNITSTAATLCRPGVAHYGASKAGLQQLTRVLALELAPHGIRVNAVAPGVIATPRVMAHASGDGAAEHVAKLARIPLAREGRMDELVGPVLLMLGPASSYCTGSVLLADGGLTLGIPTY